MLARHRDQCPQMPCGPSEFQPAHRHRKNLMYWREPLTTPAPAGKLKRDHELLRQSACHADGPTWEQLRAAVKHWMHGEVVQTAKAGRIQQALRDLEQLLVLHPMVVGVVEKKKKKKSKKRKCGPRWTGGKRQQAAVDAKARL